MVESENSNNNGDLQQNISNSICYFRGMEHGALDAWSCIFYQMPYILDDIEFEYISLIFLIPILLVSIFGDIKETYRWFILNQTFWDLFIIYDASCNAVLIGSKTHPTCFYSLSFGSTFFDMLVESFFKNFAFNGMYAPLFLLTLSRFLTMYFNKIYSNFSKPIQLIPMIISFQLLCVFIVNLSDWATLFSNASDSREEEVCKILYCSDYNFNCERNLFAQCVSHLQYSHKWWLITLRTIKYLTAPILLLTANILAIFVIIKVGSQFKFQAKNNRKNLMTSIKITVVITFQCIFLTFLCLISLYSTYSNSFLIFVNFSFPPWLEYLANSYTVKWICVVRIFCDSVIMLIILIEYRKNIVNFVIFIFHLIIKHKVTCKRIKLKFTKPTTITIIPRVATATKTLNV